MLIEITRKCMMECPHCMVNATPEGEHISTQVFHRAVKFAKAIDDRYISISGGDPFYNPDFFKYIRYIVDEFKGQVIIQVQSNGWWIEDEKLVKRIKDFLDKPYAGILQIASHSKYYKNHQFTMSHEKDYKALSSKVLFTSDWQILRYGGRAKNIMSHSDITLGPDCLQYICYSFDALNNLGIKVNSLSNWLKVARSRGKYCIPYVDVYGKVKIGEMDECQSIFDLNEQFVFSDKFLSDIFKKIQNMTPCNKCHGCDIPKYQIQKKIYEELKNNLNQ